MFTHIIYGYIIIHARIMIYNILYAYKLHWCSIKSYIYIHLQLFIISHIMLNVIFHKNV